MSSDITSLVTELRESAITMEERLAGLYTQVNSLESAYRAALEQRRILLDAASGFKRDVEKLRTALLEAADVVNNIDQTYALGEKVAAWRALADGINDDWRHSDW